MSDCRDVTAYSNSLANLYPSVIVEAYGGLQKFDALKTVNSDHFTTLHGSVEKKAVTEPIMIGVAWDKHPFIILTFDVYDFGMKKIASKVSEVFHNDFCIYEWDHGIETWQGAYQIYGNRVAGCGMPLQKLARRIEILLGGELVLEPHRFNYGNTSYIKLWSKDS